MTEGGACMKSKILRCVCSFTIALALVFGTTSKINVNYDDMVETQQCIDEDGVLLQ